MRRRLRYTFVFCSIPLLCLYWAFQLPWWAMIPLCWIAIAFMLVGLAFALGMPGLLGKRSDGRIHAIAWIALAPFLAANTALLFFITRTDHEPAVHTIDDGLFLGRRLFVREVAATFKGAEPIATIDLTAEFAEPAVLRSKPYLLIPTLDTFEPTLGQLEEAVSFMDQHWQEMPVYVHCAMGHGRSATVVAAWLIKRHRMTPDLAVARIQEQRPHVRLHPEQMALLQSFHQATC